jgi:hypothetical protein
MLYGSGLHGYVPHAHKLWYSSAEWIILRMDRKRKLTNFFILFGAMNKFSCLILPIIHAYNVGISRLRSEGMTLVVCPTLVGRRDFCHMPDSGRKTRLRSYARLRLEDMTPVVYPDSKCTFWFRLMSRLWSYHLTLVAHHGSDRWACHMSYHLNCDRLCMAGRDDCSILQLGHLVRSRLGGMHDSFSIQNLSISRPCRFKYYAMRRMTNEH